MQKKTFFFWGKNFLKKIEIFKGKEDLDKKMEIPQVSRFGTLHQNFLDAKNKKKKWSRFIKYISKKICY